MWEWVNQNSTGVQAVSTVVLAVLTACYIYWVRRGVRDNRELVERQAIDSKERDRRQIERAIQTMITELEFNRSEESWHIRKSPPLLNTTYDSNLWAVQLIDMLSATFRALGDAYLNIQRYNTLYEAAVMRQKHEGNAKTNDAQSAWEKAQKAIEQALEKLGNDPATKHLITSPG